jgi:phytoene dehydrogenase-like protein/NAD-dependent dihydropyrimidine dehydrogenase PreA subunit
VSVTVNAERCTGCNYCTITCPQGAISLEIERDTRPRVNVSACSGCGDCVYVCPNGVFSLPEKAANFIELEDHYDAIVIGAGIGGLLTACGLAEAGKKVAVLEQLSFVGGKYTHLAHKGYAIVTAAWTCPGPNSRIGRLSRRFRAPIQWITVHETGTAGDHWVHMEDGRQFRSLDEAQDSLVGGAAGMARVYDWISDMYDPRTDYPDDMTARDYLGRYFPRNGEYADYVEAIITHCFASQTLDTFSATETKRAITDSIDQMADWGTARGGTAAIVRAISQVATGNGVQIAVRTRVAGIQLKEGRAVGVTLADGRQISAGLVVHNAGLHRLIELVGRDNLPHSYLARLESAIPANVASIILGTTEPLLGPRHSLLHAIGWERTLNCYAPTFFDPSLAPQGRHILDVFWAMQPPFDKNHELELVKGLLEQLFPEYDDNVEFEIPMFYTGRWTAEMAHRIGQSGRERIDPQTPVKDLYMVGYDCIGYGMAGDIIPHGVRRALCLMLGDQAYAPPEEGSAIYRRRMLKHWLFRGMALAKRGQAAVESVRGRAAS